MATNNRNNIPKPDNNNKDQQKKMEKRTKKKENVKGDSIKMNEYISSAYCKKYCEGKGCKFWKNNNCKYLEGGG